MRPRRFDRQLQFVFMVLSGLTILVGLASIGVNQFLVQSQQRILGESIAIIERAERVALDAELVGSLAAQLALAEGQAETARLTRTLTDRISRIETDIIAIRLFLAGATGDLAEADVARSLVDDMGAAVRRVETLDALVRRESALIAAAGSRLAALISTETDLARLRITAGIWELYSRPAGAGIRPGLDRLADVDFFGFERLRELADASATLSSAAQRISAARTAEELPALESEFRDALALARERTRFMPSTVAQDRARKDLARLAQAESTEGLLPSQRAKLAAMAELADHSARLRGTLDMLAQEAVRGRDEARARMRERIAADGRQAVALSGALGLVLVLALVAGYIVWSRTRARVVGRLGAVAERIVAVARGDTEQPVPISGHDEIGRLEKSLNILRRRAKEAARLRTSLEAAVLARTADVVAEMQSANAARAEAEDLSRAKTHFLARMSHEIRTPLNGVIGLLDLVLSGEPDPLRRARLETALTSARDLQAMTEDILAFSSGEEKAEAARQVAFDPAALARQLGDHLQVLCAAKGVRPVVEIPGALPPALIGDPSRIRQVVMNLISNAVKYTASGEARLVLTHAAMPPGQEHEIAFTVSDTGPGMSADEMRHAFDIYGRTVDARRRGLPGVGLGLAIVRQLTDAMGGELRVGTARGQGSSFTLVLRLAEAAPAALSAPSGDTGAARGRRFLVVDDHPVNRLVARGYLERMGGAVTEAATGTEALAEAEAGQFDAITIDLDLPDLRGEDVAARIARKGARVAILTADLVQDDADTRARFGVDHVLTKPVSPRALAELVEADSVVEAPSGAGTPEAVLRADIADMGAGMVATIVAAFLADLSAAVPVLLGTGDAAIRRRLAHRLKGAASNFALGDLCRLLQQIEGGDGTALEGLAATVARAEVMLVAAAERTGLQLSPAGTKQ